MYINLNFLSEVKAADLLTYVALILAYLAYAWSINRDLDSWKSLLNSFREDLKSQREWLESEYFGETYNDKNSYNPFKIIYPLSFETLPEIIRRGIAEFSWISERFIGRIILFNERVIAFNSLLDHMKKVVTADPVLTEKLKGRLNALNIDKESIKFDEFKKDIQMLKEKEKVLHLAENIHRLNWIIHVKVIGNKSKQDKLHYLYVEIAKELDTILHNFDRKRPFFLRYKWYLILLTVPIFILVENILK